MSYRILLVDDEPDILEFVGYNLTREGFEVSTASNGLEAIEVAQTLLPHLVLLDVMMPEMDGIQALKKIKASDASATVIMCSAMGQQAMVIESIQAGARDFIVKPFQAERVIEAVKKVIG